MAQNLSKLHRIGLVKVKKITDDSIYALVERHATLERMHLSYCDNLTPRAIGHALNRLLRVTHLSLTGITAFQTPDLQQFCRATPIVRTSSGDMVVLAESQEYGPAQRESFCVYSGHGITALRNHLNALSAPPLTTSDEGSRRDSTSSQSSLTLPGTYSPPHPHQHQNSHQQSHHSVQRSDHPSYSVQYWTHSTRPWTHTSFSSSGRSSRADGGTRRRGHHQETSDESRRDRERDGAPVFRYTSRTTPVLGNEERAPGIPVNTLVATTPNFFIPQSGTIGWSRPPPSATNGPRREGPVDPGSGEYRSTSVSRDADDGTYANAGPRSQGDRTVDSTLRWTTPPRSRETSGSSINASRAEEGDRGGLSGWVASRFGWERRSNGPAGGRSVSGAG